MKFFLEKKSEKHWREGWEKRGEDGKVVFALSCTFNTNIITRDHSGGGIMRHFNFLLYG